MTLGSTASWCRDLALAGSGAMPAMIVGAFTALAAMGEQSDPGDMVAPLGLGLIVGLGVGAVCGPVLAVAARAAWKVHWALAMGLGVALGGGVTLGALELEEFALMGHVERQSGWTALLFGAGAIGAGPPWVAYCAVRSRGRSGLGVVAGSVVWAWAVGCAVQAIGELLLP